MPGFVSFETWSHVAWAGLELTLIAKGDLEILILLPSRVQCRDPRREHCTVNVPTTPAQICTKTTFRALESLLAPLVCGHLDLSRHGCFIQMVSHLGVPMRRENSQQQLHRGVTADYRFHHVVLSVAAAWGPLRSLLSLQPVQSNQTAATFIPCSRFPHQITFSACYCSTSAPLPKGCLVGKLDNLQVETQHSPTKRPSGPSSIASDLGKRSKDVMTEKAIRGIWRASPGGQEDRRWVGSAKKLRASSRSDHAIGSPKSLS